jgi:hypothetical protein
MRRIEDEGRWWEKRAEIRVLRRARFGVGITTTMRGASVDLAKVYRDD